MDKYENRRLRLIELRDARCDGLNRVLADKLGRADSYISRMLYPEGKPGRKRIADDMIEVIEAAFNLPRAWLDLPTGTQEDMGTTHVVAAPEAENHDRDYKTVNKADALIQIFVTACEMLEIGEDRALSIIESRVNADILTHEGTYDTPLKEIAAKVLRERKKRQADIPRLAAQALGLTPDKKKKASGND